MSFRIIAAAVLGIGLLVTGIVALASPITADDGRTEVECGTGFAGLGDEPEQLDRSYAIVGDYAPSFFSGTCADKIGLRRLWAYPAGGIGLLVLGGAALSWRRSPSR